MTKDTQAKDEAMASVDKVKDMRNTDAAKRDASENVVNASDVVVLSDGDCEEMLRTTPRAKINKKRRSVGGAVDNKIADDDQYNLLKRRKIKVAGAPKMPLNGYVRYMNERRETVRKEHPGKTALEHTKIISEEWHQLTDDKKAPYNKAYSLDKQRFEEELNNFLKANPNVLASELAKTKQNKQKANEAKSAILKEINMKNQNVKETICNNTKQKPEATTVQVNENTVTNNIENKKIKRTPTPTNNNGNVPQNTTTLLTCTPGEIPIFTTEFLEHNKICDMELRTLRKSKQDLEQQNAVLEKHVENMKVGVHKMTTENNELQKKNKLLEIYVHKLKKKLAEALGGLALPNEPNGATADNIESFLAELYKMSTSNTHGPACLNKAKDILRKLDMQINL